VELRTMPGAAPVEKKLWLGDMEMSNGSKSCAAKQIL
jgi:hypothetical protein